MALRGVAVGCWSRLTIGKELINNTKTASLNEDNIDSIILPTDINSQDFLVSFMKMTSAVGDDILTD